MRCSSQVKRIVTPSLVIGITDGKLNAGGGELSRGTGDGGWGG